MAIVATLGSLARPKPGVGQSTTLGWHNDVMAQSYMQFVLLRIQPLVTRYGWYVEVLKEFYPRAPSLLGLNVQKGREVCVRFRVPGDRTRFLPFHEVVCTAIHELTHCQITRHGKPFWTLYYQLLHECEAWEMKSVERGIPLYPRSSEAARVDGDGASATRPSRVRAHDKSAKAATAIKRIRFDSMLSYTPAHLTLEDKLPARANTSSTTTTTTMTMVSTREPRTLAGVQEGRDQNRVVSQPNAAAADLSSAEERRYRVRMAMEQRLQPTPRAALTCNNDTHDTNVMREGGGVAVMRVSLPTCGAPWQSDEDSRRAHDTFDSEEDEPLPNALPRVSSADVREGEGWSCPRCTYYNPASVLQCEVCSDDVCAEESSDAVPAMRAVGMGMVAEVTRVWSCPRCTYDNDSSAAVCAMCDGNRSDHGDVLAAAPTTLPSVEVIVVSDSD